VRRGHVDDPAAPLRLHDRDRLARPEYEDQYWQQDDRGAGADDAALLRSLGEDLKFVTITSAATVVDGPELAVTVAPSSAVKCERCWHYRDDVGSDAAHPTLCGRCSSNLYGAGETRTVA